MQAQEKIIIHALAAFACFVFSSAHADPTTDAPLAKELTQLSLPDIGEAFGGRDHTTVLHACRKIASLKSTSSEFTRDFNSLLNVLRS